LHDFNKIISFMRVLSSHNFAKFGYFISINGKIINNLLRLGVFTRRPLWCVVELLPQDIALADLDSVYSVLLRKEKPFQIVEQFSKLSLGGTTIGARMAEILLKF